MRVIIYILAMSGMLLQAAWAVPRIDITKGYSDPMPVALVDFFGKDGKSLEYGFNITKVISQDLERSGLFRSIDKASFIEQLPDNYTSPSFPSWRQINAQALVTGDVTVNAKGEVEASFRLWDVFAGQQLSGRTYTTKPENWRRVGHLIADEVYKRMTGESGYFDTRVVYVSETGPALERVKRLAIMDQDGENHHFLTDGTKLALTPRFSPNAQQIMYLSYKNDKPRVYLRDIESGKERVLGDFPGMSFAPRFAPEGKKVLMSIAYKGVTDIYQMDLKNMSKRKITEGSAIDTSPSFSPDGKKVVFNSNRGGSQQLYVMNADGGNVHRISFGEGRYAEPSWSPRGDLISFTKIYKGNFYIGVMRPDGSGERILSQGYLVESSTWSPNGRVIMYTRQEPTFPGRPRISRLYSIDLTGYNEREVTTPLGASDPAWSPLLQ